MRPVPLTQILGLVGKIDDAPGDDTPRERFRSFIQQNLTDVGQIRDYIEECLREKGDQYNRALQDLVNLLGTFLGFKVAYGRYQGVQGEIGFDGHWISPSGFHIVVEVKTTEAYAIKSATLVGYVDRLISAKEIANWDNTMGLYVVGRPDANMSQLENAIVAEKRTQQLRTILIESLLSLAELGREYEVGHEYLLAVLRPSGPAIDDIVELLCHIVTGARAESESDGEGPHLQREETSPYQAQGGPAPVATNCWLTPVKAHKDETAEECVQILVGQEAVYAFGDKTPGRKRLQVGDHICFYASGNGVVAHATVASLPERGKDPKVRDSDRYPWLFKLSNARLYVEDPVVVDSDLRSRLDAFKGRDPSTHWAWFVQGTKKVTKDDFERLTRR